MLTYLSDYHSYIDSFFNHHFYRNILEYRLLDSDFSKAFFKMVALDVDSLIPFLYHFYSSTGRPALFQIEILRAFILMTHFHELSIKKWNLKLHNDPALAILCGFDPSFIPSSSSFYDFMNRFYSQDDSSHILPKDKNINIHKSKPSRNQKLDNLSPTSTQDLYDFYKDNHIDTLPEDAFLHFFKVLAVDFSTDHHLIDSSSLTISGDGSALATHAAPHGKKIDDDMRNYSDIDANIGWDSDLNQFYFGYTEYNISTINHKLKVDLPVFLTLAKASQHDAITSITALAKFQANNNRLSIAHYCLDSASDNYPTHHFTYSLGIIPLIDINKRNSGNNVYEPHLGISQNGRPICSAGMEMISDGRDYARQRHKFRCPYYCRKDKSCPFHQTCSSSPYGRVIYIKFNTDIKLFGPIPYKSDKWKDIYKDRTSCERINNRILNDYGLLHIRTHGRKRNFFFLILIGINIHLDAYHKVMSA